MDLPLPTGEKSDVLVAYIAQALAPGSPLAGMLDAMIAEVPEHRRPILREAWERALPTLRAELFDLFDEVLDAEEVAWAVAMNAHPVQVRVQEKMTRLAPRIAVLTNRHIRGMTAYIRTLEP